MASLAVFLLSINLLICAKIGVNAQQDFDDDFGSAPAPAAVAASPAAASDVPDDICVGCICDAASRCDVSMGCQGDMCGVFKITFPYWVDAGKPILDGDNATDPEAWKRCVLDVRCAGTTVVNYVTRFKSDCNGDGRIDCTDFAHIHHLGGYGCGSRPLDVKYQRQFDECRASTATVQG